MTAHPAAMVFPLMDGIELSSLVEDVRTHGLLDPIVLHEGMVLDGRNRLRACEMAGVAPRFVEWVSDGVTALEWVVSHNLHRRHLTTAQRAALALDLLPRLEEEARERKSQAQRARHRPDEVVPPEMEELGEATEKAAALVGVGRSTVATLKAIQKNDPTGEIIDRVRAGELNVAQAARKAGYSNLAQGGAAAEELDALAVTRTKDGKAKPIYYGQGDKWPQATAPLARYLKSWRGRDFEFKHVNWKEARKRLKVIDQLLADLTEARADLESRSHKAKLTL